MRRSCEHVNKACEFEKIVIKKRQTFKDSTIFKNFYTKITNLKSKNLFEMKQKIKKITSSFSILTSKVTKTSFSCIIK